MSNFSTFFPSAGGGGAPLGSLGYLVPSTTQTYIEGKEVYESDNGSFLKSGSALTAGGGGKEDASNYDASLVAIGIATENSNAWSFGDRTDNRDGAFWNGTHIVQVTYTDANGTLFINALNQSDFSIVYSGVHNNLFPANGGIVDGDYLIYAQAWMTSVPAPSSSNPIFRRVLKTDLTSASSYGTAATVNSGGSTVEWLAPTGYKNYPLFTACNKGLSSEKHYFANFIGANGTAYCTIGQFTYNDAAATATSPWTATGSTIVLPVTDGTRIVSLAGDLNTLWVQTNTNIIYKYNSTTLALEATIYLPASLQTANWSNHYGRTGIFVIPASDSSTGNARFFMSTGFAAPNVFQELFVGDVLTAPDSFNLQTYDGTNIEHQGSNVSGWMKIK